MPGDNLDKIVDMSKEYGFFPQLFTFDTIFSEKLIHSSFNYMKWNEKLPEDERIKVKVVEDLHTIIKENDGNILKVVISTEDTEKLGELRNRVNENMQVSIVSSFSNNIEIMNHDISKGNAVKILSNYYGINKEEIICFGDAENDISMLEFAGLGIAMGNAENYVKEIADYVTDTNDNDGVAKAIEKYIFETE
jgi:Cof subfamily protein (haloacid dehalogenase superfamily)